MAVLAGFRCDVIGCELARRDVRRVAADASARGHTIRQPLGGGEL